MALEPVAVLGRGEGARSLARLLRAVDSSVTCFPSQEDASSSSLDATVRGASLLFVAEPVASFRSLVRRAGASLEGDQVLIAAARGLEPGSGKRMTTVLMEETCARQIGALTWPIAYEERELEAVGATVIGSRFELVVSRVQARLASAQLRVYGSRDLMGVELAGALSRVVVTLAGIARDLGMGSGVESLVVTRALSEVTRCGVTLGADATTFYGLSGIGDVLASILHEGDRDFELGRKLAKGQRFSDLVLAGEATDVSATTQEVLSLVRRRGVTHLPLLEALSEVFIEGLLPKDIMTQLMTRASIYEVG